MGLDSFWKLPKGTRKPVFKPELILVGGLFSGHGKGSFRGKIYSDIIEAITGESLYQEEIPNTTIREMAEKLNNFSPTEAFLKDHAAYKQTPSEHLEEYNNLRRMFNEYAKRGASLHGWW